MFRQNVLLALLVAGEFIAFNTLLVPSLPRHFALQSDRGRLGLLGFPEFPRLSVTMLLGSCIVLFSVLGVLAGHGCISIKMGRINPSQARRMLRWRLQV